MSLLTRFMGAISGSAKKTAKVEAETKLPRPRPSSDEKIGDRLSGSIAGRITFLPYHDGTRDHMPNEEVRRTMRRMIREPYVKAAWGMGLMTVASQDWQIHAADKNNTYQRDQATFIHDILEQCEGGMVGIANSILNPIGPDGYVVAEKVWQPIAEGKHKGKVGIGAIKPKHPDRIYLVGDEFNNVTGVQDRYTSDVYPISDFIYQRYLPIWDEPEGMAPFLAAYAAYWMKDTVKKLRIIHHEKKIGGMLVGEYTDPSDQGPLEEALTQASKSTWMTIPAGTRVQAMAISTASETEYKSFLEDLNIEIVTGITLASLQIIQSAVPDARGDSKVQKGVSDLAPWYLTYILQQALNRQLIPEAISYNFAGAVEYPRITFGAVSNQEITQIADIVQRAQSMGMKPSKKYYAEAMSIQEADPNDPEDILQPGGAGGMGMPGMGGMGGMPGMGGPPGMPPPGGGGGGGGGMGGLGDIFAGLGGGGGGQEPNGGGAPMPFSERGIDRFSWQRGERGGNYWLPDGKQDTPENRIYGEDAKRAALAHQHGPSRYAIQDAVSDNPDAVIKSRKSAPGDKDQLAQHWVDLGNNRGLYLVDRNDGYLEMNFEMTNPDGTKNEKRSSETLQAGTADFLRNLRSIVMKLGANKIPISYAPSDKRRQRLYEGALLHAGYVPVKTMNDYDADESHKVFWQHGSLIPAKEHAALILKYREEMEAMGIPDRMAENDWKPDGEFWISSGGRSVTDATYQRWFKDDTGFQPSHKRASTPIRTERESVSGDEVSSPKVSRVDIARKILSGSPPEFHAIVDEVIDRLPDRAAQMISANTNTISVLDERKWAQTLSGIEAQLRIEKGDAAWRFEEGAAGWYSHQHKAVLIGPLAQNSPDGAAGVFLHESAHAMDYRRRFSQAPQWVEAWKAEIAGGRLNKYSTTNPTEGFAELAGAIWSGKWDIDQIETEMPKAAAFMKMIGAWPAVPAKKKSWMSRAMGFSENQQQLIPDIFESQLLFKDGRNHIDVLASGDQQDVDMFAFDQEKWEPTDDGMWKFIEGTKKVTDKTMQGWIRNAQLMAKHTPASPEPTAQAPQMPVRPPNFTFDKESVRKEITPGTIDFIKQLRALPPEKQMEVLDYLANVMEDNYQKLNRSAVPEVPPMDPDIDTKSVAQLRARVDPSATSLAGFNNEPDTREEVMAKPLHAKFPSFTSDYTKALSQTVKTKEGVVYAGQMKKGTEIMTVVRLPDAVAARFADELGEPAYSKDGMKTYIIPEIGSDQSLGILTNDKGKRVKAKKSWEKINRYLHGLAKKNARGRIVKKMSEMGYYDIFVDQTKWERIDGGMWRFKTGKRVVSDNTMQGWITGTPTSEPKPKAKSPESPKRSAPIPQPGEPGWQKEVSSLKRKLNAAINSGDDNAILTAAREGMMRFEQIGYPDQWSNWTRAIDDVEMRRAHSRPGAFGGITISAPPAPQRKPVTPQLPPAYANSTFGVPSSAAPSTVSTPSTEPTPEKLAAQPQVVKPQSQYDDTSRPMKTVFEPVDDIPKKYRKTSIKAIAKQLEKRGSGVNGERSIATLATGWATNTKWAFLIPKSEISEADQAVESSAHMKDAEKLGYKPKPYPITEHIPRWEFQAPESHPEAKIVGYYSGSGKKDLEKVLLRDGKKQTVVEPAYLSLILTRYPKASMRIFDDSQYGRTGIVFRDGGKTVGILAGMEGDKHRPPALSSEA